MVCVSPSLPSLLLLSPDRDHPETWLVKTDKENHGQVVSFTMLCRIFTAGFKNDKVWATGKFSVSL